MILGHSREARKELREGGEKRERESKEGQRTGNERREWNREERMLGNEGTEQGVEAME